MPITSTPYGNPPGFIWFPWLPDECMARMRQPPPTTHRPHDQTACNEIVCHLKEESHCLQTIHQLIDSVEWVNNDLQAYYEGHERENSWGDNWQWLCRTILWIRMCRTWLPPPPPPTNAHELPRELQWRLLWRSQHWGHLQQRSLAEHWLIVTKNNPWMGASVTTQWTLTLCHTDTLDHP